MFYTNELNRALRFGDVLGGYVLTSANIDKPILHKESPKDFSLEINYPQFVVVLTPCCSIGDKMILLSPLIKINRLYLDNPYFSEDLTNINRKMLPEQSLSPAIWKKLPSEEKSKREMKGINFVFLEYFIYEYNKIFSTYELTTKVHNKKKYPDTKYYMIDFRKTFKVGCKAIIKAEDSPLESKYLQLSIKTRGELRDKISYFYSRIPPEDTI